MFSIDTIIGLVITATALGSIYALIAMAINLTFATANIINFAIGEFAMIGAMLGGGWLAVTIGFPLPLAALGVALVGGILGAMVEVTSVRPTLKTGSLGWVLGVIGAGIILTNVSVVLFGRQPMPVPALLEGVTVAIGGVAVDGQQLVILGVAVLLAWFVDRALRGTILGKSIRAVAYDRQASSLMGIQVNTTTSLVFAASCALAAISGTLMSPITFASPYMGMSLTVKGFTAATLGGLGNPRGALLGGFLLALIDVFSGLLWPGWEPVVLFLVLIATLTALPGGLTGSGVAVRAEYRRHGDVKARGERQPGGLARGVSRYGAPVFLLVALLFPFLTGHDAYFVHMAALVFLYTMLSASLNYLLGYAGQFSFGHVALVATGAYTTAILTTRLDWSFWQALVPAAVLSGLGGFLMGLPALRVSYKYLALATFALLLAVESLLANLHQLTRGQRGIAEIPAAVPGGDTGVYYLILLFAGLTLWVLWNLIRSGTGRAAVALRESPLAASTLGHSVGWTKLQAFILTAVMAGVAGSIYAHLNRYIAPISFGTPMTIQILLMVAVGGIGSFWGPLIGSVVLVILPTLISGMGEYSQILYGALLIASVVFLPEGIYGFLRPRMGWTATSLVVQPREGDGAHALPILAGPRVQPARGPILSVAKLSIRFGGLQALNEISMDVAPHTVHGLIGPNGSGKTTAVNLISGVLAPSEGRILFGGRDVTRWPTHMRARAGIARTFQTPQPFAEMTVVENILVALDISQPAGRSIWSEMLRLPAFRAGEHRRVESARQMAGWLGLGQVLNRQARGLTHYETRLLELARALAMKPNVLLLDEPAAGLSREEVASLSGILRRLRSAGITILLIDHNMEFVMNIADYVTVLDYGKIISEGSPREIQTSERVLQAYLG